MGGARRIWDEVDKEIEITFDGVKQITNALIHSFLYIGSKCMYSDDFYWSCNF